MPFSSPLFGPAREPPPAAAATPTFPHEILNQPHAAPPATTLPASLLKLLVQASVPEVAVKAQQVVRARLQSLLGLEDAHDMEPDLWLGHLPRSQGQDACLDGLTR